MSPVPGDVAGEGIGVEVIRAWPRRHEAWSLRLPAGSSAQDAVRACGIDLATVPGLAVHGERVTPERRLADGDRLEVLRALQLDPKQARRRRAEAARSGKG